MHSRFQERARLRRLRLVRISLILHNFSRYYQLLTLPAAGNRSTAAQATDAADRYAPGRLNMIVEAPLTSETEVGDHSKAGYR